MQVQQKKSGYLPSLDGWRAFAILGVLMTHDMPWVVFGHSNAAWKGYGGYGVNLFFAISGVLICTRILEEEALVGQFRIGRFYIRRFFRIQPAAFAYLATIAILILTGIVHEHWHFWLGALFLYQNFLFHAQSFQSIMDGYFTGHFWTLAVEEHFYILLSLFLLLVKRRRILILGASLVMLYLAQKVARHAGLYSADVSYRRSFWILQFLFLPAWFALLLRLPRIEAAARRYLTPWATFLSAFLLLSLLHIFHFGVVDFWSLKTIDSVTNPLCLLLGLWVIATMLHPQSWTTRLLEWKPLRFIGRLSYSIYVWHLLFFCTGEPETHITWTPMVFLGHRPQRYLATFVVAMLSYFLIEKRFIRYGHQLAPPATPGHADLAAASKEATTA